jgi:hypothetical protein
LEVGELGVGNPLQWSEVGELGRVEKLDLLEVAFLTSAKAASSILVSLGAATGAGEGGAAVAFSTGVKFSGVASAGVASVFEGVGAVAGAGAGGATEVSVGFVSAAPEASAAAVGVGLCAASSSFFLSFFLKRPLKARFMVSIASGAVGTVREI